MIRPLRADEIVAAHEQRIGQQNLRSRRRIMHVVEPHDGVPQRRGKLTANILQLVRIPGRFIDQRAEIDFPLIVHMLVDPVAKSHGIALGAAHGIARQLDVAHPRRQTL